MDEKQKEEFRKIADKFKFLQELIKNRMDCGDRSADERNQQSELEDGCPICNFAHYGAIWALSWKHAIWNWITGKHR